MNKGEFRISWKKQCSAKLTKHVFFIILPIYVYFCYIWIWWRTPICYTNPGRCFKLGNTAAFYLRSVIVMLFWWWWWWWWWCWEGGSNVPDAGGCTLCLPWFRNTLNNLLCKNLKWNFILAYSRPFLISQIIFVVHNNCHGFQWVKL